MIVCQCSVVSDRSVRAALDGGARTVAAVCRATGAAQDCGSCIFTVKAIVCQSREEARHQEFGGLLEVDGAAS